MQSRSAKRLKLLLRVGENLLVFVRGKTGRCGFVLLEGVSEISLDAA